MKGFGKIVVLSLLSLGACVVGGNHGASGNVTFVWSFSSATCAQTPGVSQVHITIPGQSLQSGGVYPCDTAGTDGIVLTNFAGGSYPFTIDGVDANGTAIYSATGSFDVNGDVSVAVDLTPIAGPTSLAYFSWTFPPSSTASSPTCADESMTHVLLAIDGAAATTVPCGNGQVSPGVSAYMAQGNHSALVTAVDANGTEYFGATVSFSTVVGQPLNVPVPLQWTVGGENVGWNLYFNNNAPTDCATAGVSQVDIQFYDTTTHNAVFSQPVSVACTANAGTTYLGSSTVYPIPAGTYDMVVTATGTVSPSAFTSATNIQVTITAGQTPSTVDVLSVIQQ